MYNKVMNSMEIKSTYKRFRFVDEKGRTLLKSKGNKILVGRYCNMEENVKQIIAELYSDLTGEGKGSIISFLNFENEEMEFCS